MGTDRPTVHVGDRDGLPDAPWTRLPPETTRFALSERAGGNDADDDGDPAATEAVDPVVVVRLCASGDEPVERLRRVRERFPGAPVLAYTADGDADAAIDASRLGVEYVSGRRLTADGETLAARVTELTRSDDDAQTSADSVSERSGSEGPFLERFVRITADRTSGLEEKLDALLDLGRERLDLSIGYASQTTDDRFTVRRHRGGSELLGSLIERGVVDADGSIPLENTYCRRTVGADEADSEGPAGGETVGPGGAGETASPGGGGETASPGGVVAFTDPAAAGWDGDPAHELFGLGSYIGGQIVVDDGVVGSLCFVDELSRDRPFSVRERLFVELLADWLGRAFERRAAREQREAAVGRLEDTLERVDDAFLALDDDWRFTYVNEKAAALLGRPADEIVGANVWEEFPDAIGETYEESYRRAMETQESVSFVERYEALGLRTEVTAYPSPDGMSVFLSDVTDRRRRERILERLLGTVERVQRADDKETIADRLIEAAAEVLGYEISGVRLYDPETDRLRLVATSEGLGERFADRGPRPPGEGVTGEVYERGEPWVCDDVAALGDDRDYYRMRSFAAVPLGDHGAFVVGAVEPNAFDEDDVSVLELLATNAVAAMDAHDRRRRLRTYENALKNVDDMVCVLDGDGAVTYATAPFAEWLGTSAAALVGRRLRDAFRARDGDRIAEAVDWLGGAGSAADGVEANETADGVEANETADGVEANEIADGQGERIRRVDVAVDGDGDGRRRHGEIRLSALSEGTSGVVASLTDTTDLRRTRTELSREQDRFDRLFERLPDPVIEVALEPDETVIAGINPAFASRFGYDAAAIRGRSIDALDIRDDRLAGFGDDPGTGGRGDETNGNSLDERVRAEGFVTAEVRRRTVDGPREFLFRGFTYETAGGRRAFGIYTDITDRRRRERYFRVVNRILRHNLRNELNVVFGFASEIATDAADARIADHARRIETTGKRLADIAEGATEIRRIVEEGIVSDPDPVWVDRVAAAVCEEYADRYPEARTDVAVPDNAVVRGDERLGKAIGHLVENAVVHSGADAPRVEIRAECHPETETVTVRVADDGPGVPDGVREVITGEAEVTQLNHNTGIGLWIVAWTVEAYGGDIGFGPGIGGEGTTVALRLPAATERSNR
ncbi:PAS domain-containing protein [Halorubrum sp. Boch-26]|uniref:PAS domain-containing protein n=1 Tax=Halorubrum sp. Boch-26 TaxID=2994426 RepID=UPI002469B1C3|nr:PAS domain-containing protein [Halorubrum sp. Boch-26]